MHVYVNGHRRMLEEITKQSQMLLEKGLAARFIAKDDSKEVMRLIERLREAIAFYQVSESCHFTRCCSHGRIVVATTGDLRPSYRPHCEDFSVHLYDLH